MSRTGGEFLHGSNCLTGTTIKAGKRVSPPYLGRLMFSQLAPLTTPDELPRRIGRTADVFLQLECSEPNQEGRDDKVIAAPNTAPADERLRLP